MPKFRCFIRGENFPSVERGRLVPMGFYVHRFVVAKNSVQAEREAVQRLKKEFRFPRILCRRFKTTIYFEEVVEAGKRAGPEHGAVWFPMNETART